MGNIKKIFLIILLLTISYNAYAQEKHFIEISISDTLILAPLKFIYQISISDKSTYYPLQDTVSEEPITFSDIEKILDAENFTNREYSSNYSITTYSAEIENLLVYLNSKTELKRLYDVLKKNKGVTGKIISVEHESYEPYYTRLFERMYKKALTEATKMAEVTGNETSRLISVTETKAETENFFNTIMEYYKEYPLDFFNSNPDLSKTYIKKLLFRFELK
ncbi:MAG: hypothetical protein EHM58_00860 [Ignavibacteriae bacterium]|nr:MAG: hypothetical protein EHM58_00860 [Ignavibacteriota bacterium]